MFEPNEQNDAIDKWSIVPVLFNLDVILYISLFTHRKYPPNLDIECNEDIYDPKRDNNDLYVVNLFSFLIYYNPTGIKKDKQSDIYFPFLIRFDDFYFAQINSLNIALVA